MRKYVRWVRDKRVPIDIGVLFPAFKSAYKTTNQLVPKKNSKHAEYLLGRVRPQGIHYNSLVRKVKK